MYHQAWPWAGTATASPTSGYVQPTAAASQVATTQWPAGYSQYAVSPEIQQQWAAAWASQAQYAYGTNVPLAETQTTAYAGAYPDYQTAANVVATTSETKKPDDANSASDKPKNTAEQGHAKSGTNFKTLSQDATESEKIKQLKEQAEKWTSLKQQQQQQQPPASWPLSTENTASAIDNTTTVTAPNDSTKSLTSTNVTQSGAAQNQLSKEEEEFERQFKDWEKQFETWKQQNQNHPDKEAFAQYEKQWQEWRAQLLQKKEQMQKAKAEQSAVSLQSSTSGTAPGFVSTQTSSTSITDAAAATSTTGMYYQHPQYMYMQPYMYPGATSVAPVTVPPAVVPPAVVPPAVVPPGMVPPTGVPPVSMQPGAMPPQQMAFNVPPGPSNNYGNQLGMSGPSSNENMNYDNRRSQDYENDRNMYNYGPMQGNGPRDDGMGPNFEGFDNPNMNMPEGEFGRDNWKFGRGRGGARGGRGRTRGRGSRWSEPTDADVRSGASRTQRKTLLPGGPPGPSFPEDDGPPPFEYPTEDCRDDFKQDSFPPDRHGNRPPDDRFGFQDGTQQYPPDDGFASQQPFDDSYPPDQYPPDPEFPDRFPPDQRFPPDRKRFPPDQERFPPGREGFSRGGGPLDHERFPPDDRFAPDQECFPPDQERFPPKVGRFFPEDEGFPPDDSFPPGPGRFPPRHMMDEGGFGGEFDHYPPEDEMYGPPPFRDDFPPFDDRGGRGRGRFSGRGGRRFRGEFDRFGGPPFPQRMRNDSYGPQDFPPPDDRFGFSSDGPPRMPPPRGMRPPFEPPFGPEGRFPDEPDFFGDGPNRFKTIDYTHRPAVDVMGDDFNPHYDYESEFQDDVNAFRARPPKRKKRDAQRKSAVEKKKDMDKDKDTEKDMDKDTDKDLDLDKDKDKDIPKDKPNDE